MTLRVLDEVIAPSERGVVLLSMDGENAAALKPGAILIDALGGSHGLKSVSLQEGIYTLHLPKADPAYFERLLRNVLVDATLFTIRTAGDE